MNERAQKLWSLCNILRDDGVTYHEYVTELTFLLFLKMADETGMEAELPGGYRWADLGRHEGEGQLGFYKRLLVHLGARGGPGARAIFAGARTTLAQPRNLRALVEAIDRIDWYDARTEGLGDLYEGLLERNAGEKRSGAGQYFTPRPLIDAIIRLVKPREGEVIQDPAAGTGGFLVAADRYIKAQAGERPSPGRATRRRRRTKAFSGVELVPDAHRLLLMNLMLHGIDGEVVLGDALARPGASLPKADVIVTNPPFGARKGGGPPARDDLPFPTSNKPLAFLQHVYHGLKAGGRAAVVMPDNVLFEGSVGALIRADLMEKCDLHTILRLPTGIFHAPEVKTNVLFFRRGAGDRGTTKATWVFDLRTGMPLFGKRTPLTRAHFAGFEEAFGESPLGTSRRRDTGHAGRLRKLTRRELRARGDNLDICWLPALPALPALPEPPDQAPGVAADERPDPEAIAAEIVGLLRGATAEMERLQAALGAGAGEPI